jgi:hypothetical protein
MAQGIAYKRDRYKCKTIGEVKIEDLIVHKLVVNHLESIPGAL